MEASIGSFLFAPDNPNLIPESASFSILNKGRWEDSIEIQVGDNWDIQVVDR